MAVWTDVWVFGGMCKDVRNDYLDVGWLLVCWDGCLDGCYCVGIDVWMVVSVFGWLLVCLFVHQMSFDKSEPFFRRTNSFDKSEPFFDKKKPIAY
jgi:hypothetical protein